METTRRFAVYLTNNEILTYEIPTQVDRSLQASYLDGVLREGEFVLETDQGLVIIPRDNVLKIEIIPAPEKLPPHAIRGVKQI
ncbi:MAG: hypothetical protein ACFBSC_04980 [Microcoleaceae cyanobacterium]